MRWKRTGAVIDVRGATGIPDDMCLPKPDPKLAGGPLWTEKSRFSEVSGSFSRLLDTSIHASY
jgi:hypothetical protein